MYSGNDFFVLWSEFDVAWDSTLFKSGEYSIPLLLGTKWPESVFLNKGMPLTVADSKTGLSLGYGLTLKLGGCPDFLYL